MFPLLGQMFDLLSKKHSHLYNLLNEHIDFITLCALGEAFSLESLHALCGDQKTPWCKLVAPLFQASTGINKHVFTLEI